MTEKVAGEGSIPAHAGEPTPQGRNFEVFDIGSIPAHAGEPRCPLSQSVVEA